MKTLSLVWLRRELRLQDNEALYRACQASELVLPFYIIDPYHFGHSEASAGRNAFILESLIDLKASFSQLGGELAVFETQPLNTIKQLLQELKTEYNLKFFYSTDIQYTYDKELEESLKALLEDLKIPYIICRNDFLLFDESKMDQWRDGYYAYLRESVYPAPTGVNSPVLASNSQADLAKIYLRFKTHKSSLFSGGERAAHIILNSFFKQAFRGYHWKLSRPWMASQGATSHLSPHLTQGTISSRIVHQKVYELRRSLPDEKGKFSLRAFADRLRWRDSFRQRFYFHPEWASQNRYAEFDEHYNNEPLTDKKEALFRAWCDGQTGYPLVDASMRQLKTEGWLNFRMRAMCATFLSINCGVSWHYGSLQFMNCLIDGDVGIDHWQWQMQAGVINPLVPTFRIYNPQKNLLEKDPDLLFVKHWVPELKPYNIKQILNYEYQNYPKPLLNWSASKEQNGKIISGIRARVKERLIQSNDSEYLAALTAKKVVEKYYKGRQESYERMKGEAQLKLDLKFSNESID
jgi:deoxyribodipyrimidine photo-lyase